MNRNALKLIAVITMTIDHIGAFWLTGDEFFWMRIVGRLAFPIFMFLFAEGARRSPHNRTRKVVVLFGFAVVTQLLFDWVGADFINILFLLTMGMIGFEIYDHQKGFGLLAFILLAWVASFYKVDYMWFGIATLALFYIFDGRRNVQFLSFAIVTVIFTFLPLVTHPQADWILQNFNVTWRYFIEVFAILALGLIALYDPTKNRRIADPRLYFVSKYFFYVYYPLHIVILNLLGGK